MRRTASSRERPLPAAPRASASPIRCAESVSYWARDARLILFLPHILGKIVIAAELAFEAPAHPCRRPFSGERFLEESLLRRPGGVRLRFAIAARHGVVEPAMRRARIKMHVVGLLMVLQRGAE